MQIDAVVGVLDALVLAVNNGEPAALTALLREIEDPQGQTAALFADRRLNGEIALGQVAVLYPTDPRAGVDVSVAVWHLPAGGAPAEGAEPLPWIRMELDADGRLVVLEIVTGETS